MKMSIAKGGFVGLLLSLLAVGTWAQNAGVTFHVEDLEPIERTFPRSSSYNIANTVVRYNGSDYRNGVIKSSIDGDSLIFFGANSFYKGLINAYASHRAVILSPDVIWLLISQGFAAHVNLNSDELRDKIVYHQGKKTLEVISNQDLIYNTDKVDWKYIFSDFEKQIRSNTKNQIADIITADFSTTGMTEKIASQITLMESVKSYFEYKVFTLGCGIPDITLTGTPDDWRKVREKTQSLKGYGLDWWIDRLDPILKQFVDASQGTVDTEFWMEMVGSSKFRKMSCGMPTDKTDLKFDGWFTVFYPYDAHGDMINGPMTYNARLLPEIVETPFIYEIRGDDGITVSKKYDMQLYAGIIGMSEDPVTGALKPEIGWMVRCTLPDVERDYYYNKIKTDIPKHYSVPLQNDESIVNSLINPTAQLHKSETLPMVVLDGRIIHVDEKKLAEMVENKDFSPEKVSELLFDSIDKAALEKHKKGLKKMDFWSRRSLSGL